MTSWIRRRLSYANVVATMALLFAMGGSAIAAKHYLVSSTNQISPQVLKQLEAKIASRIKPGATGAPGAPGAAGKEGAPGAAGQDGAPGKDGTPGKDGAQGQEGDKGLQGEPGLSLLSQAEQEKAKAILPFLSYVAHGVGDKPTIQFSGVNVQLVSGEGKEEILNGMGNLVVGYDEKPREQTGSNNLVIGSVEQEYTSYGAILGGEHNSIVDSPYSDVFGTFNTATERNGISVNGGHENVAGGEWSSIGGGYGNRTESEGTAASVSGGEENTANALQASVSGGKANKALGEYSWIGGGYKNEAKATFSSIFGGKELLAEGEFDAIP